MPYRSSPDPKRRSFPKKDGGHKSYGSLPNLNNGSKDRVPHPSLPLRPQYLPFSPLTVEDALAALGLGDCLTTPAASRLSATAKPRRSLWLNEPSAPASVSTS